MKKLLLLLTLLLLLLPACEKEKDYDVETEEVSLTLIQNPKHEVGTFTFESGEDDLNVFHIQYPEFETEGLNKAISQYINETKERFYSHLFENQENPSELHIAYQSKDLSPYATVEFMVFMSIDGLAHPISEIKVFTLNPSEDKVVTLEEIATEHEIKAIRKIIFEKTQRVNDEEPFIGKEDIPLNNFSYDGTTLNLYFDPSEIRPSSEGIQRVSITGDDIINAFHIDVEDVPTEITEVIAKSDLFPVETPEPEAPFTPVRELDPGRPALALTFDDGPSSVTPALLDLLDAYQAKGTFFVLGVQVPGNEGTLQRMHDTGHLIGNHTYNHRYLPELTAEEIQEQLSLTDDAIEGATGHRTKLFRPTYGEYNDAVQASTTKPFILWSVDTNDWQYRDASHVSNHIIENAYDGSIILMHDIYETTLEGLKVAIHELINQGYQLVTVEELAYLKGYSLESYQSYYDFRN